MEFSYLHVISEFKSDLTIAHLSPFMIKANLLETAIPLLVNQYWNTFNSKTWTTLEFGCRITRITSFVREVYEIAAHYIYLLLRSITYFCNKSRNIANAIEKSLADTKKFVEKN